MADGIFKNPKTLLIGLDGVDYNLIERLIDQGITPNLGKLCKEGVCSRLLSTVPLQTPITWTSFITGKNAGKHGIYAFFAHKNNSYELKVLNSLERKSQTLWHILNEFGKTVGIFNLPSLFPPEKIDGYMVCGMLAPSTTCNFTYPRQLKEKLLKAVKGYEIDIGMTMSAKDSKEMLLNKTYDITDKRIKAAKFLLDEFKCDLTMLIFTETDRILHFFLKDMGTESKYKNAVIDYFRFLDEKINELIERVDKETTIIVMSDHGMEPFRKVFYVNNLLSQLGLAVEKKASLNHIRYSFIERFFKIFIEFMVSIKLSPEALKRFLPQRLFDKLTLILGKKESFDWGKTKAYFSSSIGEGIIINLKGRQPEGIVPAEEYEKIRDMIIREIEAIRDPDTMDGIVEAVYKREDLYSGDFVHEAPDILLQLKNGYIPHSSTESQGILVEENPLEPISSDHTLNAMLILHGEKIKKGIVLEKVSILDVAPTILGLMNLPVPGDFDGRILNEIFTEGCAPAPDAGRKILENKDDKAGLTEEEEKQVRATLKKLGYLKDGE